MTATAEPTGPGPADPPAPASAVDPFAPRVPDGGPPPVPADPVGRLVDLLEVTPAPDHPDRFLADNPATGWSQRVYGGQVAAQALRAAAATVTAPQLPHSLHAYFLRPGAPGVPIAYDVERTRDGRSFSTRRVLALQGDDVIFETSVSFHADEPGLDYQLPRAADVPEPDDAPDRLIFIPEEARPGLPMDLKELGATDADDAGGRRSTRRAWMRIKRRLPDDPVLHRCLLTYLSDMGAVFAALAPGHGLTFADLMGASLDHALWFHRPMRADEWFLYDLQAVSNAGLRGLARGTMHTAAGELGASMAQEALLRRITPRSA